MAEDRVSVSVVVTAAPAAVWHALIEGRSAWWPEMVFEPVVGAPLTETWVENGVTLQATGVVTSADPPHLLVFVWSELAWQGNLTVTIRLTPVGSHGTEVSVVEQGFTGIEAPSTLPAEHLSGWRFHLDQLSRALPSPRSSE